MIKRSLAYVLLSYQNIIIQSCFYPAVEFLPTVIFPLLRWDLLPWRFESKSCIVSILGKHIERNIIIGFGIKMYISKLFKVVGYFHKSDLKQCRDYFSIKCSFSYPACTSNYINTSRLLRIYGMNMQSLAGIVFHYYFKYHWPDKSLNSSKNDVSVTHFVPYDTWPGKGLNVVVWINLSWLLNTFINIISILQ